MTLRPDDATRLCDEMNEMIGPLLEAARSGYECCFCYTLKGRAHMADCPVQSFIEWRRRYNEAKG